MLDDFRQAFNDPASWHAMVVHFPIVLGSLAFLPILAAICFRLRHKALLWTALVMLLMLSVATLVAIRAGEAADTGLTVQDMMPDEEAAIQKHEDLAENGWLWPLIPAALVVAAIAAPLFTKRTWIPMAAASLAVVGALGVAGWMALTAHAGGQIVYIYGIGPPERGSKIPISEWKKLQPAENGSNASDDNE